MINFMSSFMSCTALKVHSSIFAMSNYNILSKVVALNFCRWNEISDAEAFRMLQEAFGVTNGVKTSKKVVKVLKTENVPDQPLPMNNTARKWKNLCLSIVE